MKFESRFNIGDEVYGIDFKGGAAHGTIDCFFIGSDGKLRVSLREHGYTCFEDSIGTTEIEAMTNYYTARMEELLSETKLLKKFALDNKIEVK